MTKANIDKAREQAAARVNLKFETASAIRALLDAARKAAGPEDADDFEGEILALVTED